MSEKRQTRATGSQVKAKRATHQTTLKDLFQRTKLCSGSSQELSIVSTDPGLPLPAPDARPSRQSKPSAAGQLYPMFTRMQPRPQDMVTGSHDTEIIDITDDAELSTESHSSSTQQPTPRSGISQVILHSIPPSPISLDVDCDGSDMSQPHSDTRERTHSHNAHKINTSNKRILECRDVGPLPSSCSQHVRGLQRAYTAGQAVFKQSVSSRHPSDASTPDFFTRWRRRYDEPSTSQWFTCRSLTPQECQEQLEYLRRDYNESHPAFARICVGQEKESLDHAETWTRSFRPRRADEVLGNERHARYLRDWLRALELRLRDREAEEPRAATNKEKRTVKRAPRGIKRPRVIRAVTRTRGNKRRRVDSDDELDAFVVFSDAEEEQVDDCPAEAEDEDEYAFCERTLRRLHRREALGTEQNDGSQFKFGDHLTNTVLISGPPGCGKTAAVYACAEELGWEVFEVYPGIGKRNGASLDHLVGDVGKNHIVQTVQKGARTKTSGVEGVGLNGYVGRGKTRQSTRREEVGIEGELIQLEDESARDEARRLRGEESREGGESETMSVKGAGTRGDVRQSVVLLEEVDILFKEDGGFWTGVVELIRNSQRPVVMTCNDVGLVPVGDLPVQKVLVFEPCPSEVAATFLQCLTLTEGWHVGHEDLVVVYERGDTIQGRDGPEGVDYPRSEPVRKPDLRRSINQLQILLAGARQGSTSEMQGGDEAEGHVRRSGRAISVATPQETRTGSELWRGMRIESEVRSHVDGELGRMGKGDYRKREEEEEEMGYVLLERGEESYGRDELIGEEAIRQSRGVHEERGTGPMEASINPAARLTEEGNDARVEYESRMVNALQGAGILGPPGPMVPQRGVYLDYIPWVGYMVTAEDVLERRGQDGGAGVGGGRCTRNSMGLRYVRTVGVGEEWCGVMRRSRLVWETI